MKSATYQLFETLFSAIAFFAIVIAIATTAIQVFNPENGLIVWLADEWNVHPVYLALLGGVAFLMRFWLQGLQGERLGNVMFYGAVALGMCEGVKLLLV
jgi:hypothetical protein